ncbi:hypothetical protein R1flu_021429 [Riccia fluitans]|uniref:Fe2OG dioxygenase domain-containing protein n=1 Tax=Riccia fluitans TaxID=41844 RepID=A0ABD1ZRB7_9MARC
MYHSPYGDGGETPVELRELQAMMSAVADVTVGADATATATARSLKLGGLKTLPIEDDETAENICHASPQEAEDEDILHIPVIDFAGFSADGRDAVGRRRIVTQITEASKAWGMFNIVNHGIPQRLLNELHKQAHEFFALPLDIKEKVNLHYEGLSASNNYQNHGFLRKLQPDPLHNSWREDLAYFSTWDKTKTMIERVWMDRSTSVVESLHMYLKSMDELSMNLLEILAEGLGLESNFFSQHLSRQDIDDKRYYWRVNFYPPCQHTEGTVGMAAHSDPSLLTVLSQDEVSGLQVMKGDRWVDVLPVPGALVVNVGDLLEAWSNGTLHSAVHRVVVSKSEERVSWAFLVSPPPSVVVQAPEQLIDEGHPRLYKPFLHVDLRIVLQEEIIAARESGDTRKLLPKVIFYDFAQLNNPGRDGIIQPSKTGEINRM